MPTTDEIERARKALAGAPTTEHGIVIPPHVAAAREQEQRAAEAPKPNRAQRRQQERAERRRAKQTAKMRPEQAAALARVEEATGNLTDAQLVAASATIKQLAAMTPEERERFREEHGG